MQTKKIENDRSVSNCLNSGTLYTSEVAMILTNNTDFLIAQAALSAAKELRFADLRTNNSRSHYASK